jgi:hypothetical protein
LQHDVAQRCWGRGIGASNLAHGATLLPNAPFAELLHFSKLRRVNYLKKGRSNPFPEQQPNCPVPCARQSFNVGVVALAVLDAP